MGVGWSGLEVEEWRMGTSDIGNYFINTPEGLDYWRRNTGILGHDGKPRYFNPVTELWDSLVPYRPTPAAAPEQETEAPKD